MKNALGGVQSAVVFGGTSEIALATLRKLLDDRLREIVLAVRDPEAAHAVVDSLTDAGAERVEVVSFDAAEIDTHGATVDEVVATLGDVDLALIAFGTLGDQDTFDADPTAAAHAVTVNFTGAVSVGLHLADRMRTQGHGTIAVLSSVAGERVRAENLVYGASKAGLDGFAQGLGDHLDGTGVHVMVVRPGFVHTRMTEGMEPAPLSTTADAVAEEIVAGLARDAEIVWAPPTLRWLFSGLRHLPRPLWRRVADR